MESNMDAIIELESEVLIDRSQIRNAYLRLLLAALGRQLIHNSQWIVVEKRVASVYEPLLSATGDCSGDEPTYENNKG
jgi:hypothetical protein